jgi:hypothetical protein
MRLAILRSVLGSSIPELPENSDLTGELKVEPLSFSSSSGVVARGF